LIAITREVSAGLGACELSFVERSPIDIARARLQHRAYQDALRSLGCVVRVLPELAHMADAVFVEDTAIVLDEVAIMTRPGAASRRGEGASVADALRDYRPLRAIESPGTLDGGDVLRIGRVIHVGESARSNAHGIAQLRELAGVFGYRVRSVPVRGCLHLKSAVTALDDETVLLQSRWVDREWFAAYRIVEVDEGEEHAANVLRAGRRLLMPACFPRTQGRLFDLGYDVLGVDLSELQKAEGAVTCCSLLVA
jgi:dimethylargininase